MNDEEVNHGVGESIRSMMKDRNETKVNAFEKMMMMRSGLKFNKPGIIKKKSDPAKKNKLGTTFGARAKLGRNGTGLGRSKLVSSNVTHLNSTYKGIETYFDELSPKKPEQTELR